MFEGKHKGGAVGGYDTFVVLAERYHWTPDEVRALDPDYIDELLIRIGVESEHNETERKKQERDRKRNAGKGGSKGEDVDISEI